MQFWINTVSLDHVQNGLRGGFTQANHGSPHNLKRMKAGDYLAFYSPKTSFQNGAPLQEFTAIGKITDDEPYQVEMTPDFHPFRRNVEFFHSSAAPIRPLIESLSFIQDKQHWGFTFRRGLFTIPEDDFRKIAEAMRVRIK